MNASLHAQQLFWMTLMQTLDQQLTYTPTSHTCGNQFKTGALSVLFYCQQ
jgi:hypothetical protein